jgi:hypothetical protein
MTGKSNNRNGGRDWGWSSTFNYLPVENVLFCGSVPERNTLSSAAFLHREIQLQVFGFEK